MRCFRALAYASFLALVFITPFHSTSAAAKEGCPKIVGGCAGETSQWPSLAVLRLASSDERVATYICGGTAIASRWVLTAAHCLQSFGPELTLPLRDSKNAIHQGALQVVFGAQDLRGVQPNQLFGVERIVIHENYRAAIDAAHKILDPKDRSKALDNITSSVGDDIALLYLDRPWSGAIAQLSLSGASDPRAADGVEARVAGFGKTEHNQFLPELAPMARSDGRGELFAGSATLLQTLVPTVATTACAARYPTAVVGDGQICAGLEQGGRDSCNGDSGGPLMAGADDGSLRQVGVVSWGYRCAEKKAYGVYTRVSHYGAWIQTHTGPLRGAPPFPAEDKLTADQLQRVLAQFEAALGTSKGRIRIGVRGGNKVRLRDQVVFEVESAIAGRLVLLDVDASRQVSLIYPNQYVAQNDIGRIRAGATVAIPGPDYPGFTAFEARAPVGTGTLIALVAPEAFDIERFAASLPRRTKGFVPVNDPPNYMMQLIRQIEVYLGVTARAGGGADEALKDWGYAVTEYEITP
jgi:secreted trypsin-like serine protease